MTIFLIHTAVKAETKERDKLVLSAIDKLKNLPSNKLKETYKNYDYTDKEYISLAVKKNGTFIVITPRNKVFNIDNTPPPIPKRFSFPSGTLFTKSLTLFDTSFAVSLTAESPPISFNNERIISFNCNSSTMISSLLI